MNSDVPLGDDFSLSGRACKCADDDSGSYCQPEASKVNPGFCLALELLSCGLSSLSINTH
jgi:hypothetical protein